MFYIIVFLILSLLSYFEYKGKYFKYLTFKNLSVILTIISIIRFGQGSDYFAYLDIYSVVPPISRFSEAAAFEYRVEPTYLFLCSIFKTLDVRFEIFIAIIAIVIMTLIYKFIRDYSKMPITSITIFFALYYLIYVFSAIRQGIAMALFLALGIPFLKDRKYIRFIIVVLIAATMHSSILIVILLIPIFELNISKKLWGTFIAVALLVMATGLDIKIIGLLPQFLSSRIVVYWGQMSIPLLAIGNRLVVLLLILYFSSKIELDKDTNMMKRIYIISFILYILTIKSSVISSRISVYMKVFEIIIIPNMVMLLKNQGYYKKAVMLFFVTIILMLGLLVKNLSSFVYEGSYNSSVKFYSYPYITIFDKESIWTYRDKPKNFHRMMEYMPMGILKPGLYKSNDPEIYSGNSWIDDFHSNYYKGYALMSNSNNDTMTFKFNGTGFRWHSVSGINCGIAQVTIDDKTYTVDNYSPTLEFNKVVFEKLELPYGKHVVEIKVTNKKNSLAKQNFQVVDSIEILE